MVTKDKKFQIKNPRREEVITVERKSANGVFANGKWYNFSKFKPQLLAGVMVGGEYRLVISTATSKTGEKFENVIDVEPTDKVNESSAKLSPGFVSLEQPKKRDFDAEARGKTRCAIYAAAVTGLAESIEEAIEIAERGVAYSFQEQPTPEKPMPSTEMAVTTGEDVEFPD